MKGFVRTILSRLLICVSASVNCAVAHSKPYAGMLEVLVPRHGLLTSPANQC